jgi:glycosyltransferase involved in cell wall biosynthesis
LSSPSVLGLTIVSNDTDIPLVSIGMPVFNGAHYLSIALNSILKQTYSNFELIISDNASTDKTEEICLQYASKDPRIKYYRQPQNIGPVKNFLFVLEQANSKYFMWAAADDKKSSNFLEKNVEFLDSNPGYVASTSPTYFYGGSFNEVAMGDGTLDNDCSGQRIKNFYNGWHANARFYSLIRRSELIQFPFKQRGYLGSDWTWVIYLAKKGKLKRLSAGSVELGSSGESNSCNIFKNSRNGITGWFMPFYDLSRDTLFLLKGESLGVYCSVCFSLLRLNLSAIKLQSIYFLVETKFYKNYKRLKSNF